MTDGDGVLLVTLDEDPAVYEAGLDAIRTLRSDDTVDQPATLTFANERQLGEVFNERTYRLLRVIRDEEPGSIRETARVVDRDKKNVHGELSTLEALGVIRFEEDGRSRRPVFPFDSLVISPLAGTDTDEAAVAP
jgi:predicted transcriptional regulator